MIAVHRLLLADDGVQRRRLRRGRRRHPSQPQRPGPEARLRGRRGGRAGLLLPPHQDNAYWSKCTSALADASGAQPEGREPAQDAAGAGLERELRDRAAAGQRPHACDTANAAGIDDRHSGRSRARSASARPAFSNGVQAQDRRHFRRRSFLDYLYFTDMETSDPAWYTLQTNGNPTRSGTFQQRLGSSSDLLTWAPRTARVYWRDGRGSQRYPRPDTAWQQQVGGTWGSTSTTRQLHGDPVRPGRHDRGPFHTNDDIMICGSPTSGARRPTGIEVSGTRLAPAARLLGQPELRRHWRPTRRC